MSHQDFKNIAYVACFRYFIRVFVLVFVIVFVFVFVFSYDFWIAIFISFQNMYGYTCLWRLWAVLLIIFKVMTHIHTHTISTYRLGYWMGRVKSQTSRFLFDRLTCITSERLSPAQVSEMWSGAKFMGGLLEKSIESFQHFCCFNISWTYIFTSISVQNIVV